MPEPIRKTHRITPPLNPNFYRRPPKPPLLDRIDAAIAQHRMIEWAATLLLFAGLLFVGWIFVRALLFAAATRQGWRP